MFGCLTGGAAEEKAEEKADEPEEESDEVWVSFRVFVGTLRMQIWTKQFTCWYSCQDSWGVLFVCESLHCIASGNFHYVSTHANTELGYCVQDMGFSLFD